MGLTTGCAVCHDHKFDPISQRDFYALSSFFNNLNVGVRDGNISNPAPVLTVPRADDRRRLDALTGELAAAKAVLDAQKVKAKVEFARWSKVAKPEDYANAVPTAGLVFHAPLVRSHFQSTYTNLHYEVYIGSQRV